MVLLGWVYVSAANGLFIHSQMWRLPPLRFQPPRITTSALEPLYSHSSSTSCSNLPTKYSSPPQDSTSTIKVPSSHKYTSNVPTHSDSALKSRLESITLPPRIHKRIPTSPSCGYVPDLVMPPTAFKLQASTTSSFSTMLSSSSRYTPSTDHPQVPSHPPSGYFICHTPGHIAFVRILH